MFRLNISVSCFIYIRIVSAMDDFCMIRLSVLQLSSVFITASHSWVSAPKIMEFYTSVFCLFVCFRILEQKFTLCWFFENCLWKTISWNKSRIFWHFNRRSHWKKGVTHPELWDSIAITLTYPLLFPTCFIPSSIGSQNDCKCKIVRSCG